MGASGPTRFLAVAIGLWSIVKTYKGDYDAPVRAAEESVRIALERPIPGWSTA